ncbi:ABC transporter permease [Planotetraspora sp. GP83]|uniref:ABC transporter permease n=1 Tax=Planotetraspora sp. GP83 TaxID=3156264 RepID=UPI003513165C
MTAATPAAGLVRGAGVLAARNLRVLNVKGLVAAVVNPLLFFVAFYVVLHNLLESRGVDFGAFFPPGIVVQAMGLGAIATGQFAWRDQRSGLFDRYRQMPIHRGAILAGRLAADLLPAAISVLVVVLAGLLTGFRFEGGPLGALGFLLLALAFWVALATGTGAFGIAMRRVDAVTAMLFVPFLPLINFSTAFVPVQGFPGWLQPVVRLSPFTAVADGLRALAAGGPSYAPVWQAVAWIAGLTLLFFWSAMTAFRRMS